MKAIFAQMMALVLAATSAVAADTSSTKILVVRNQLGIGSPAKALTVNSERGHYVNDGMYHVPQYLPGYPTAAVLWARTVEVNCRDGQILDCDGYHWLPEMGRGEYLFVVPRVIAPTATPVAPTPVVVKETTVVKEPYPVYVEVPVKPKKQ